jgi:uncharacterized protein YcbK (DUF882 family)
MNDKEKTISRRDLIKSGLLGVAGSLVLPGAANATLLDGIGDGGFDISFRNMHTGESFSGTYRVGSKYLPDAFDEINYVLRDFRANEEFPIDPRIIDIIYMVRKKAGVNVPFEVLSGYRSPKTNSKLRNVSTGVAKHSLHMTGQALDFRLHGFSTRKLREIAVSLKAGGVGYYSGSNFVHVDTGRVRHW